MEHTARPRRSIIRRLIEKVPLRQKNAAMQTRELVLLSMLWATLAMMVLANAVMISTYVSGEAFLASRVVLFLAILAGIYGLYWAARRGHFRVPAYGLLAIYYTVGLAMLVVWGVDLAVGLLVMGLVITLTAVLLGARQSLYATALTIATLFVLHGLMESGVITPDRYWAPRGPIVADIIGMALILGVQAAVSWVFNMRMERALRQALRAEDKLSRQKALLEIKVAERTKELQAVQLEKTQQVYNFAELGQRSMGLLHELANNLTTLNFDIEALSGHDRSQQVERVKKGVAHIEASIRQVRAQLQGEDEATTFAIEAELQKVVESLTYKAQNHSVTLVFKPGPATRHTPYTGDAVRFRQMATNIISNGIDAYGEPAADGHARTVTITVSAADGTVAIAVSDYGKGIPADQQAAVFEPFNGSNPNGMGLGLYIARRIAEQTFGGTTVLKSTGQPTTFIIYMAEHAGAH